MSAILEHISIEFNKDWFKSGYYVYVITITTQSETIYYIGQTGDRFHKTSRSPFYRLWGHYNPYNVNSGTDSQLFKGLLGILKSDTNISNRIKVEQAISKGELTIKANYFKIKETSDSIEKKQHKANRVLVEEIETHLIQSFQKGHKVLNKPDKIGSAKRINNELAIKIAEDIFVSVLNKNQNII